MRTYKITPGSHYDADATVTYLDLSAKSFYIRGLKHAGCMWVSSGIIDGDAWGQTAPPGKLNVKTRPPLADILWMRRIFARMFPNLPEKVLRDFCLQIFSHKDHEDLFLVLPPKKVFMCFSAKVERHFLKSSKVGRHFCPDFRDFVQIFKDSTRIFDKSKLLGVVPLPGLPLK